MFMFNSIIYQGQFEVIKIFNMPFLSSLSSEVFEIFNMSFISSLSSMTRLPLSYKKTSLHQLALSRR